jgi:putative SOS response-associated peptidase YedK
MPPLRVGESGLPEVYWQGGRKGEARSWASATVAFRDPLANRRCLVPADGFYQWQRRGKSKQPYCFEVNDGELFAFAGLWDRWRDPSGQWIKSCSILTTTPNAVTSAVHDRNRRLSYEE